MFGINNGTKLKISSILFLLPIFFIFSFEWNVIHPYGAFNVTYYDELADAFLAGQLHLLRTPSPEMMALPDPWNPATNEQFREAPRIPGQRFQGIHDLSLYDGKFYLQWGPFPALFIIPLRFIAGHDLPMGRLVLIIETISALAYAMATIKLARLTGLPQSRRMKILIVLFFVLCPVWTFTLRTIAIYEAGIFFGQFCMSLALLSAVVAFDEKITHGKEKLWLLALASIFLGFMVNCRSNLALLGLMVPVILYVWSRIEIQPRPIRQMIGPALALGCPAMFLLISALVYNKIRFGSFMELGQTWQLWGGYASMWENKFHYLRLGRIVPNIWYYFLSPVEINLSLLLIHIPAAVPASDWLSPEMSSIYDIYVARTSGLFILSPLTILTLFAPLLFLKKNTNRITDRARWIVLLLILSGVVVGFPLLMAPAVMRYAAEWCMWWVMAGTLIAIWIRDRLLLQKRRIVSRLFDAGLGLSILWSSWVGVSQLIIAAITGQ
jgi:hypothetical protein